MGENKWPTYQRCGLTSRSRGTLRRQAGYAPLTSNVRGRVHPEIQRLVELLESIQALLTKHGEKHWSVWLEKDVRLIINLDLYGVEHFLSSFGGMGSINDLVLHSLNDHRIQESETDAVNTQLHAWLGEAYLLAHKLYREDVNAQRAP